MGTMLLDGVVYLLNQFMNFDVILHIYYYEKSFI